MPPAPSSPPLLSCFAVSGGACAARPKTDADSFEVHLTTDPLHGARLAAYRAACQAAGVKAIVMDLGPGIPVQPMTCARVHGTLPGAHAAARRLQATLGRQGFPTRRVKIEAAPWNAGVPGTDEDAGGKGYFEFHAKLELPEDTDLEALAAVCRAQGAHLSHNPFKRAPGTQHRFVTLRRVGGRLPAEQAAAGLCRVLAEGGWATVASVLEYCVYDDHRALDAAWEGAAWAGEAPA